MTGLKGRILASIVCCCMAGSQISGALAAEPAKPVEPRGPSFYLQCDGNPNNMAAGESVARLIGAVTLLAVFAPEPEAPDASKRKFGAEGVAACSQLIDGEKAEGNVVRRLPLILARAIHRIEAKDYAAALSDVELARQEATAANLTGNPYFNRSLGMSMDLIAAAAHLRKGDVDQAIETNYRPVKGLSYSYYPLLVPRNYTAFTPGTHDRETETAVKISRLSAISLWRLSADYAERGRFTDAASALQNLMEWRRSVAADKNDVDGAFTIASIAVYYALAGDWAGADKNAHAARTEFDRRKLEGKPVEGEAGAVEMLDLFDILKQAQDGKLTEARRSFAARSRWVAPSFGQISETTRLLRTGAKPEELFGALAQSPDEMRNKRRDESLAALLQADTDNRTLFTLILPYASVSDYESMSGKVWNMKTKAFIGKQPLDKLDIYLVSTYGAGALTQPDVMLLHCALQAKSRGKEGLNFFINPKDPTIAFVRFGNRGEPGMVDYLFIEADPVIAELREVIPPPVEVAARRAARAKAAH